MPDRLRIFVAGHRGLVGSSIVRRLQKDAAAEVLAFVSERAAAGSGFVSLQPGGQGAVRSLADAVLAARGRRGRDVLLMKPPE